MADVVNTGLAPNDNTGDLLRDGFRKINVRFNELLGTIEGGAAWAPLTAYTATPVRQWVVQSGLAYIAIANHTRTAVFADDLAAGKWLAADVAQLILDLSGENGSLGVGSLGGRTAQDHFTDFLNVSDKTSIQAAVDAYASGTVQRGSLWFSPGADISLASEVLIHRKTIKLNGQNAAIAWTGSAGVDMFRVTDSARVVFESLILLGSQANPPRAAINFDSPILGTTGTNENHILRNVTLGRHYTADTNSGGSANTPFAASFQYGVLVGGAVDGNNDEFTFENMQVHGASVAGISFANAQHIWSQSNRVLVNDSVGGMLLGSNHSGGVLNFNRCTSYDLKGIRNIEVDIQTLNAENTELPIWSIAGASFRVDGGKIIMNKAADGWFARFEGGGSLILRGIQIVSVGAGVQRLYYRQSSAKASHLQIAPEVAIPNGTVRSTYDVDTGGVTALPLTIDISQGQFRWKKDARSPYTDRTVTPASTAAGASQLLAVATTNSPYGMFFNVAYGLPLQGQHLTVAYDTAVILRARLFNPTGGAIALAADHMRWMAFEEHIVSKASGNINAPLMSNGTGHTGTVTLPGAKLGDFVAYATGAAYTANVVTCYVSAADTVAVRIHNASGGNSDPADTTFHVAKVAEFGNFNGVAAYTPAAIANGATISVSVTVPGAQVGGHVFSTYTADLQGLTHTAEVSSADTVTITISNYTGGSVTLAAGHFRAMVAF
jgi:hypothetical protein